MFSINGKPILVRGGGWAPDMFLRETVSRTRGRDPLRERHGPEHDPVRREDRGRGFWNCAIGRGSWSLRAGAAATSGNTGTSGRIMTTTCRLVRSRPDRADAQSSLHGQWLYGSDNPPAPGRRAEYLAVLKELHWPNSAQASATARPHRRARADAMTGFG